MADTHADDQAPWPSCLHRSKETGKRCTGKQADGFGHCLAHLRPGQLNRVMRRLHPGADLDASGTPINAELLAQILRKVQGEDKRPRFGQVSFAQAHFSGDANFRGAQFTRDAWFSDALFSGTARFDRTQFSGGAMFPGAQFTGTAGFAEAQFTGVAMFLRAQFTGAVVFQRARFTGDVVFADAQFGWDAWFEHAYFSGGVVFQGAQFTRDAGFAEAQFSKDGWFQRAHFTADAGFQGAQFAGDALFSEVRFENATSLGPLAAGRVSLDRAVFGRPVVIKVAALTVSCRDATWSAGVDLRLRYAEVDLERAIFTTPSFATGSDQTFVSSTGPLNEEEVRKRIVGERRESRDLWIPLLTSLRGSDAANLSITDVDLSQCAFAGARLLDQLRLEGRCIYDHPPRGMCTGWAWPPAWRWSSRRSIAEERTWRATTRKYAGWRNSSSTQIAEVGPERLAGLYRQLRKAQEDAKNEPGAADFYYGEMEMRRHATVTPAGERAILWLYWLISGYGLRALRSLAALLVLGVIVTTALVGWGLAATAPPQHLSGTITSRVGNRTRIDATLNTAKPHLPPAGQRWIWQRTWTSTEVTLDSIVFRTTSQPLTTTGTWTTDTARILGPVLLALTLLAVRNRVKR